MLSAKMMEAMGIEETDGVMVAHIPRFDQVPTTEEFLGEPFHVWEHEGGCMVVDGQRPLRWWQVKAAARHLGYGHPEPVWTGQADDLSVECLPKVERKNMVLALRSYKRGPWVTNFEKEIK